MLEAYPLSPRLSGRRKLFIGMSGQGTDIYVPESMLEEAKEICEAEEIEYRKAVPSEELL